MSRVSSALYAGLKLVTASATKRWSSSLARVQSVQEQYLLNLLRKNAETEIGQRWGFGQVRSYADYQRAVPPTLYEDFQPYIRRLMAGEQSLLTAEPVDFLAPTSGSNGEPKLIPYTASLRREFRQAIYPWMSLLFRQYPGMTEGPAYWQVTPVAGLKLSEASVIPIGFGDDSEYFGPWGGKLIRQLIAVPECVSQIADTDVFQQVTLRCLLQSPELRFISIWNPTFLTLLLQALQTKGKFLATEIERGLPGALLQAPETVQRKLLAFFSRPQPERAKQLRSALRYPLLTTGTETTLAEALWPNLQTVSCWRDNQAALYATELQQYLPSVPLQAKGLIATEGIVTIPTPSGRQLAYLSHFFEFAEVGSDGQLTDKVAPAEELEVGGHYQVLLTTGGGLYRYQLGDQVGVINREQACPSLIFQGRDRTVDCVGEKLTEQQVVTAVQTELTRLGWQPNFWLVAPTQSGQTRYVLFIQHEAASTELQQLATSLDSSWCTNPHYEYARRLGQLGPVGIFRINPDCRPAELFLQQTAEQGQRLGNIKCPSLHSGAYWATIFPGEYL